MREHVYRMMRWWLDRGVDGFRMDVINFISKDPDLPDGVVTPGEQYGDGTPYVFNGPRIHEFLHEMNEQVFQSRDKVLLTVGEMPGVTVKEAIEYTAPERHEVNMVFQFEHMQVDRGEDKWDVVPFSLRLLKASLGHWQRGLAERGWNSLYWNNHDQPRVVSRFGDDERFRVRSAKTLGTVLHMQRGTPYVYQGEELGMTNGVFHDIDDFRDIESINEYNNATALGEDPDAVLDSLRFMSRDNGRTPMQWDDTAHAGFTTGQPWIDVNPNYKEINAEAQALDKDSVLWHYQQLVRLRHEEPVVAHGDFTMLLGDDPNIYAFTRRLDDVELLVLGNFSADEQQVDLPDVEAWETSELLLTNVPQEEAHDRSFHLAPWESRIYRRERTNTSGSTSSAGMVTP